MREVDSFVLWLLVTLSWIERERGVELSFLTSHLLVRAIFRMRWSLTGLRYTGGLTNSFSSWMPWSTFENFREVPSKRGYDAMEVVLELLNLPPTERSWIVRGLKQVISRCLNFVQDEPTLYCRLHSAGLRFIVFPISEATHPFAVKRLATQHCTINRQVLAHQVFHASFPALNSSTPPTSPASAPTSPHCQPHPPPQAVLPPA